MLHSCSLHSVDAVRLILVWPDRLAELITNQLNNSMDQSPSWEANSSPASQETPYIFWNLTVPYHTQWSSPHVAILNHISSVVTLSSYVLKIDYIIQLFMPSSSRWLLSFRFPHQNSAFISLLSYTCHPSYVSLSWFNQLSSILWGLWTMKLMIMQFSAMPCYLLPCRPQYVSQHPLLEHPQSVFFAWCEGKCRKLIKNNRQYYLVLYILIEYSWIAYGNMKNSDWVVPGILWV